MNWFDRLLNQTTMYRLVEYYLAMLVVVAAVFSFAGILPFDPYALLFTTAFLVAACVVANMVFARTFRAPTNVESAAITGLILALIVSPLTGYSDLVYLGWMAVLAMASKYILAYRGKHLFNPAALAVAVTAVAINQTASWWVGTGPMLPFVLIGGVLLVRKIRRLALVLSFLAVTLATVLVFTVIDKGSPVAALQQIFLDSPLLFFAFVFLTEPLTLPPTRRLQVIYAAIVGVLFAPQVHFGSFYLTPELAILAGNVFSFLVSPKAKLVLQLKEKIHLGNDLYDFVFTPPRRLAYAPGQYMEWTLGHADPDVRGNRRYFTLASSPTEEDLRIGVKFPPDASSYKQSMLAMDADSTIVAAQLAGDFTLPADPAQRCVLIAGGIGITPFRSMIKYLLDTNQRRPIQLFYSNRTVDDIVYKDVFDAAQRRLGIKTIYTLTDARQAPAGWSGYIGHIDAQMIARHVPDYQNCLFYLSGPNAMVDTFAATLRHMGVPRQQIRKDYFPGF